MAAAAYHRPAPAFTVSASARENPLVRDLYDEEDIEEAEEAKLQPADARGSPRRTTGSRSRSPQLLGVLPGSSLAVWGSDGSPRFRAQGLSRSPRLPLPGNSLAAWVSERSPRVRAQGRSRSPRLLRAPARDHAGASESLAATTSGGFPSSEACLADSQVKRPVPILRLPVRPAEDMHLSLPLETPERATRAGLIYKEGAGFGLPTGTGWDVPLRVSAEGGPSAKAEPWSESARSTWTQDSARSRSNAQSRAIEVQQSKIRERLASIESSRRVAVEPALAAGVSHAIQAHLDELELQKTRAQRGLSHLEARQELNRLEQRNESLVQTCLELYRQMGMGAEGRALQPGLQVELGKEQAARRRDAEVFGEEKRRLEEEVRECERRVGVQRVELAELRMAHDIETSKLKQEKQATELRLQAQINVLTMSLEEDSELKKLRTEIDRLLVLQTASGDKPGSDKAIGHLQAQLKRAHAARLNKVTSSSTKEEKNREASRGLVAEVEVLSLTNAQLVLDLHRMRQERVRAGQRADALQGRLDAAQKELEEAQAGKQQLGAELAALGEEHDAVLEKLAALNAERESEAAEREAAAAGSARKARSLLVQRAGTPQGGGQRGDGGEVERGDAGKVEGDARLVEEVEEKGRLLAEVREELRATVRAKEALVSELEEVRSAQRIAEERWEGEVSAAREEAEIARQTVAELEGQLAVSAEEYRAGLQGLQADLEMSADTLRMALREAKAQLSAAKGRLQHAQTQLADKNALLAKSAGQIVDLEQRLREASETLLQQSAAAGCLACRKANLGARSESGSKAGSQRGARSEAGSRRE